MPKTRKPNLEPVQTGDTHGQLTAIAPLPDRRGWWLWQCSCGQYTEKRAASVRHHKNPTCGCGHTTMNGLEKSREYTLWRRTYRRYWDEFSQFWGELGPAPDETFFVVQIDPMRPLGPRNAMWGAGKAHFGNVEQRSFDGLTEMLSNNKEIAAINKAAYEASKDPSSFEWHLNKIERESQPQDDLVAQQLELESTSQDYAAGKWLRSQNDLESKSRMSQADVGREFLYRLVPIVAIRLEENVEQAKKLLGRGGAKHGSMYQHLVPRLLTWVDYHTIAYIATACTMDAVGRGATAKVPMMNLMTTVGERLDHEMFLAAFKEADPRAFKRLEKQYLLDPTRTYKRKVYAVQRAAQGKFDYEPLSNEERVHLGDWALMCLNTVTTWFEAVNMPIGEGKVKSYLCLSQEGMKHRTLIEASAMAARFSIWPMVCPPQKWSEDDRGGYLKAHPGGVAQLVHGNRGTELSEETFKAINRLQEVPWRINRLIYEIQKELLGTTNEIGAFKSYERDSWMDQKFPRIDPKVWEKPKSQEATDAKALLTAAYDERALAEKQRQIPQRVLETAARFVNFEQLYLPVFVDARGRLYYMCDTISPQGSDYQKALLEFAEGTPVTPENFDQIERDYLINLANTWDKQAEGYDRKSSKLTYEDRVAWARKHVEGLEFVVDDPLCSEARKVWTSANEPFLYLATLVEYWNVCVRKTQTTAHAPIARDATNSGSQILGGVLRDERLCHFCNVVPSPDGLPQDMYGEVAKYAQAKWSSFWRDQEFERINNNNLKKAEKIQEEQKAAGREVTYLPRIDYTCKLKPEDITRSVAKRSTMCSAYGASHGSKWAYVKEELEEAGFKDDMEIGYVESLACTNAVIKGQDEAFPQLEKINRFFMTVGRLCLATGQEYVNWRTPTGNLIRQEYREPLTKDVHTHAMGGGKYYQFVKAEAEAPVTVEVDGEEVEVEGTDRAPRYKLQIGWGDVIESKTASALAANWTHSIDASVAVKAINSYGGPCGFIHDCLVAPPGRVEEFTQHIRVAYHTCVTANLFDMLAEANNLSFGQIIENIDEDQRFVVGKVDIDQALTSPYLFT